VFNYTGVNHIALATNNMDKTIRFWRDLLGMKLVAGLGGPGHRQYFLTISDNCYISFFEWPDVEPVQDKDPGRPFKGPLSLDHICICLRNENDLWALKDRLEVSEVWTSEVLDHGLINSFFSTDPNNIQLEFCCKVEGYDLDNNPRMVDAAPTKTALEGSIPLFDQWPSVQKLTPPEERPLYKGELKAIFENDNKWGKAM
jgi:catechol 2,3-dioxygenase-like lactoylglutathione lyase family enzyme